MRKGHRNDENKPRSNVEKIGVATSNKECVASSNRFGAHFLLDWYGFESEGAQNSGVLSSKSQPKSRVFNQNDQLKSSNQIQNGIIQLESRLIEFTKVE